MKHIAPKLAPMAASALALALAACSSPEPTEDAPAAPATDTASADPATSAPAPSPAAAPSDRTLRLEGLGGLVIGKPVPAGSSFTSRGAQIPGSTCRTLSSPDYPGVYAMTIDGEVRRISVGEDSDVALVEGIGGGATEAEVRKAFPGFVATPHKYLAAPGKYLTQPGDDPRLSFEIDTDGKVSLVHVGLMPELGFVEGCA